MTVYGDGKQTRSFQYVADLVRIYSESSGIMDGLLDSEVHMTVVTLVYIFLLQVFVVFPSSVIERIIHGFSSLRSS